MKEFAGKIAVITGGGTGMGRELARQLVAEGCNVAMCDVSEAAMAETKRLCEVEKLPQGLRVTTHVADVSIEDHLKRFRDELAEQQKTDICRRPLLILTTSWRDRKSRMQGYSRVQAMVILNRSHSAQRCLVGEPK
ncbi:hypothetical protein XH80_22005 [Bradyrhizobium sp. CCBAU 45384]|nr:hypothetical protein [Bradyrhizobium sp. CCBAU 45384]